MADGKVLDKIAKLLALETSPNEHEARTARLMAAKLMREHGVSREDVLSRQRSSAYEEVYVSKDGASPKGDDFRQTWKLALAAAAAEFCGAYAITYDRDDGRKIKFAGRSEDVSRAVGLYSDLSHIVKLAERLGGDAVERTDAFYGDPRTSLREKADSFRRGVVFGICQALGRARRTVEPSASPEDGVLARPRRKEKAHADRVQKHGRRERDDYLDDAPDKLMYLLGQNLASSRVVVDASGDDVLVGWVEKEVSSEELDVSDPDDDDFVRWWNDVGF